MKKNTTRQKLMVVLIIALGIFLRLYKIDKVPFGLNHDGAWSGIWALELSQKPWPIQVYSDRPWLGEAMPRYMMAVFIKLLGPTSLAIKLGMMIFSIAALPMFYLLTKYLLKNRWTALIATFWLAVSGWDITYGKSGWRTSAVPLFVIICFLFLLKAVQTEKLKFYVLTGLFLALAMNAYNAAQFMPIFVLGILVWHLIKNKKNTGILLKKYFILGLVFLAGFAPMINYALKNWGNYTGRSKYLFVMSRVRSENSWEPLWENLKYTVLMFTDKVYAGNDFYVREPLLDFPVNILFLTGGVIVLWRIKREEYRILLFWFLTALIPSLAGTPEGSHAISTLPAVCMSAGIATETINRKLREKNIILPQLIIAVLLLAGLVNTFNMYLGPRRKERWGFYPETIIVANFIKPYLNNYDVYLTDNYPRDILTYLTYGGGDPWTKRYYWLDNRDGFLKVETGKNKGLVFVMFADTANKPMANALMKKFPGSKFSELNYTDDNINRPAAWVIINE